MSMSANEPNSPHLTQEALVEQLERQQERISRLETLLQEVQRSTPPQQENSAVPEREGRAASFAPTQPRPVVSLARLSAWTGWIVASILDKEENQEKDEENQEKDKEAYNTASGAVLSVSTSVFINMETRTETVSSGAASHYEPTLRFDKARLRRAHRRLEAGSQHTGWRTPLTLVGLGLAALALVQWQQYSVLPSLPAPPALQASAAPPQPAVLSAAVPTTTLAQSAPAFPPVAQVAMAQTGPVQAHASRSVTVPRRRLASAGTSHSTSSKTRSSFASKSGHSRTQIATAARPHGKPAPSSRLTPLPASPDASSDEAIASNRPDISEQTTREETRMSAEPGNDIQTNVNHAIETVDKMRVLLAKMEQNRRKAAQ